MSSAPSHKVSDLIAANKLWIGDGYRAKNSELAQTGIPFARAGDINQGFHFTSGDHLPEEDAWKAGNKLSEAGDVVFTSKGTVGRFGYVTEDIQRFVYSPQLCYWRTLDRSIILPRFLFYWMQGMEFYRQYKSVSQKTDMAEYVSLSDQRAMEITLPAPLQQKAIAHILGSLDDKIELNRKTNETMEAMAKALFQSWFVDFDPVRAKAAGRPTGLPEEISELFPDSFEESELGEIPRGWDVGCLSDCCEITMGQSPPGDTYNEEGVGLPFYQGKTDFGFRFPGRRIYCTSSTRQASEGATLISVRAPVGSANVAKELCAIGRGIAALKSRQDAKSFVYYLIGTLQNIFESYNSEGTVFGAINGKNLASIMVTVPEVKVISAFNAKCSSVDEMIKKNTEEAEVLASIRDTLLPKLISGELRIPEAEKLLEQAGV